MTALLAVLVLSTFTVSGEVVDVLTGRSRTSGAYMNWTGSDGVAHSVDRNDFIIKKQNMSKAMGLLTRGQSTKDHDDPATAKHLLADALAKEAGVAVTDGEMSRIILEVFGTEDSYRRRLAEYRTSPKEFEETLRSILRVRRYEMLLMEGFALPAPADVERKWKEAHQEYSVETVELSTETFLAESEAACPAGEELKAWFDSLPAAEQSTFRRPIEAKTGAEFVWFSIDPFTKSERLLAKYPRPESEDSDEVARTWYEANKDLLYVKPELPLGK
jgi:hypothetical protein